MMSLEADMNKKIVLTDISLCLIACLLFLPGLGSVHLFDWDEINFAESAREMLVSGNWLDVQVNFETFWEKPPLFIWMQALSMKLFGVNEFAARFPNAVCGVVTLLVLFHIGLRLKGYRLGLLWTALYVCSLTPFFYFKSGIIDPWFNLFIFLGTYWFVRFTDPAKVDYNYRSVILSAFFLGLAVLTKGSVGFLIFLLTFALYVCFNRFRLAFKWGQVLVFFIVLAVVGGFWFILQIANGHFSIIQDFIIYQIRLFETKDAGHGGFLLYHFVVVFIGVLPASVLSLPVFRRSVLRGETNETVAHMFRWMMMLLWVVLVLFTIVRTKIVHYSSMCYLPLTFLAAWQTERVLDRKAKIYVWQKVLLLVFFVLLGSVIIILPFFDGFKHLVIPYCDEFTAGNLQATSSWMGLEPLIGVTLCVAVVLFCVWQKKRPLRALCSLLGGSLVFISLSMLCAVPQVEKYTQGAMIRFVEDRRGEDCYVWPMHKSYAHYFYADRQPSNNCADKEYLMGGSIDKPCYFIARDTKQEIQYLEGLMPDADRLYAENGFVFYVRRPAEANETLD